MLLSPLQALQCTESLQNSKKYPQFHKIYRLCRFLKNIPSVINDTPLQGQKISD